MAKSKELGLDVISFNCMLHACARLSQATQAEGIFKSIEGCQLEPTQVTYNAVISSKSQASVPKTRIPGRKTHFYSSC